MQQFKIRCSAIGKIMTNSRKKDEVLGDTAKTYCKEWLKEQLYKRRNEFSSKYTDKGNIVEDNSIDFIADELGFGMVFKNEQFFENDFMTGTPDLILSELVVDMKNSWDCFTFPLFDTEITKKDYLYQLQGYMQLTKKNKAKLIYTLMDTPVNLIEKQAYYWCKDNGYDELDMDIYKKFEKNMTYSNVDSKLRYKVFELEKDESIISAIEERVIECRKYIETLKNSL